LDKPAGMVVHPTYKHVAGTLVNALLGYSRRWPPTTRPSLVGRLDKLTSGVVLVAKSAAMHAALQRTMASSRSEKEYLAVVYGRVNVARGQIDLPLARDPLDRRRMAVSKTAGAPSVTKFERLARVAAPRAGLSVVRCRLLTGRTHQIRVHLAARGWPIVGDPVYGDPGWSRVTDAGLASSLKAFPRQALHAWRVALRHPVTGEPLRLEAPLPADIERLLAASGLSAGFRSALEPYLS
jgi:23S rRNA pseudouridine1911/1915/1917 synthase